MGTAPLWSLLCLFGIFHVQLTFGTLDEFKGPLPLFIGSRPIFGFSGQHLRDVKPADADYEKTFTQTLDHFNDNDKRTFQQRYFVNTEWKSSTNGAVHILWLEGEGTASAFTVSNISLPHLALAKDLGATAWALEHRFYGKSQPFTLAIL
ncbi:serine carboxypeptidase s28 domain-containing protein [Ditylenchus destructor]|nr:serine carboxypeptidase s28 domain-containing protein [Ditylenchus destructor]